MPRFQFILAVIVLVLLEVSFCLTMRGLFADLKTRTHQTYPDQNPDPELVELYPRKSFVRTIGTVAGREIIPRRWTHGAQQISEVSEDENGIFIPVNSPPHISEILRTRSGLHD